MDTPATGRTLTFDTTQRAAILGSVTVPGSPEHVSGTRAFIASALAELPGVDRDAAILLTSELVTNAIQHTDSGAPGGTVTVAVLEVPGGVLVEVVDDGSPGMPVVKADLYAAEGHGLFLVQQIAARWGFLRDPAGTTVWFHLAVAKQPDDAGARQDPPGDYLAAAAAARTAASTPEQMPATSSSQVT